jgi:hypothetical protein
LSQLVGEREFLGRIYENKDTTDAQVGVRKGTSKKQLGVAEREGKRQIK